MFDIGWSELLVVGLVALVVVGPKELPALMRTIGNFVKKIKQTAGSFQRQFEEAVEESELGNLKNSVDDLKRDFESKTMVGDLVDDPSDYDKFDPDDYETFDVDKWNKNVMEEQGAADYQSPAKPAPATVAKEREVAAETASKGEASAAMETQPDALPQAHKSPADDSVKLSDPGAVEGASGDDGGKVSGSQRS